MEIAAYRVYCNWGTQYVEFAMWCLKAAVCGVVVTVTVRGRFAF